MRPFLLHILLLLALCFALSNCKHEPPPEEPKVCQYDSSVEEMKKWYYFKTGTWWVYQEQTTGELDTITVYYDWEGTNGDGTVGFEWYANSSWDGYDQFYTFNDSYSIHCLSTEECTCHKVERVRGQAGDFVGAGQIFLYPLIEGNYNNLIGFPNGQITGGTSTITDLDLNFILDNEIIQNVVRWDITTDQSIEGWPSVYLIAEDIGIVQREHSHTNELWKLINYHIIQ
jgi:hypothetical protein